MASVLEHVINNADIFIAIQIFFLEILGDL